MIPQQLAATLIVGAALLVAYFAMNMFGVMLGLPLFVALILSLFLLVNPRRALVFSWACLSLLPFAVREYMGQSAYLVLNEGVVLLLWAAWIARILISGGGNGIPKPLFRLGMLTLGVSAVSMIMNRVNPAHWAEWVLTYLLPLPVLAISRTYLHNYTPKRLLKIIVAFMLLQFVLNMTWHAGINPLRNRAIFVDLSSGTYGNTAGTAYMMLAVLTGGMCYLASAKQNPGRRILTIFLLLLACFQFWLTFTMHAYAFLPVIGLVYIFLYPRKPNYGSRRLAVAVLALSIALAALMPLIYGFSPSARPRASQAFPTQYAQSTLMSVWHGPKVGVIRRVLRDATPMQKVFGMGPNSAVSYTGFLLNSPQTMRLVGDWYNTHSGRKELSTGSIRDSLFSGTVMLLSEIGLFGLISYLALLTYPLVYILRRGPYGKTISAEMRFLLGVVIMLLIVNLVIGIVWDVWRIRMLSVSIWLLFGRILDSEKNGSDLADATSAVST